MKYRFTLDIEMPHLEGESEKDALAYNNEEVFTDFLNFAICKHLEAAMEWMVMTEVSSEESRKRIIADHKEWAQRLRDAEPTMKLTPI
jgi:hypothetical protein